MHRTNRSGVGFVVVSVSLLALGACDSIVPTGPNRLPTRVQYLKQGSACDVEIYFSDSVKTGPASQPSYYRLSTGEFAVAVEPIADVHAVIVSFPSAVGPDDLVEVGVDTPIAESIRVSANTGDDFVPQLVSAGFLSDAYSPTIVLTYDDALDSDIASDPGSYALQDTINHPLSARVWNCGRCVTLVFDRLNATTSLAITGLIDVNGLPLIDEIGTAIQPASEENRPEVESVSFVAEASSPSVMVTFTEAVDGNSAESVTNYVRSPAGDAPLTAALQSDGRSVLLTFPTLDLPMKLDVSNIVDLSGNPMVLASEVSVIDADDQTEPAVVSASVVGREDGVTLRVTFSEVIADSDGQLLENYILRGSSDMTGFNPTRTATLDGGMAVDLTFEYIPPDAVLEVVNIPDLSGNGPAGSITVQLANATDDLPPAVVDAVFPADSTLPTVEVTFDKALDATYAQDVESYSLTGGMTPTSATLQPNGRTVRLITPPLSRSDTLTVLSAADEAGNSIEGSVEITIDSSLDEVAPQVSLAGFLPNEANPTIQLELSEVVDRTSAETPGNYTTTSDSLHAVAAELMSDGRTVMLTFGPTAKGTQLSVTGVTDLAGVVIEGAGAVDIVESQEYVLPTVVSASFVPDSVVPTIDVVFSEAVDKVRAESSGFYVAKWARTVATSAVLQNDGRTVRVVFSRMDNTEGLDVRSVVDLSGNAMASVSGLEITPDFDGNVPYVLSAGFEANATTPTIIVKFSEAIDLASAQLTTNYYTVGTQHRPTTAVLNDDSRTVELTFENLKCDTRLIIERIADFAGNQVKGKAEITVARNDEVVPPTIVSATVTGPHEITIVFSEAVDEVIAESETSYTDLPGAVVFDQAVLQADGRTVVVSLSGVAVEAGDTIDIAGVRDLSLNVMEAVEDLTLD